MPLKDLLKKRDKHKGHDHDDHDAQPAAPEFTFLRTDTNTQEIIQPPSFPDDPTTNSNSTSTSAPAQGKEAPQLAPKRPGSRFRSVSSISVTSNASQSEGRRLSQRLHLRSHSYASSGSSVNVPSDLPSISDGVGEDGEEKEAMWEERATRLARGNPLGLGREGASKGGGVGVGGDGAGEGGVGGGGDVWILSRC